MLYNSHKDRVQVSECFFWYLLTQVDLDKALLKGLLLLLAGSKLLKLYCLRLKAHKCEQWTS